MQNKPIYQLNPIYVNPVNSTLITCPAWICLVLNTKQENVKLPCSEIPIFKPFLHPIYQPLTSIRHSQRASYEKTDQMPATS